MGLMNEIIEAIQNVVPGYYVTYEEASLMNVRVDEINGRNGATCQNGFCYVEEFRGGAYETNGFRLMRRTRLNVYFCKLIQEFENCAASREAQREDIEVQAVIPFIKKLRSGKLIPGVLTVERVNFFAPLPRFDAHEVSLMVEFDIVQPIC